jgi:hypothetical protein
MAILTKSQKKFLVRFNIKVGGTYMFPGNGFEVYEKPDHTGPSEWLDTNPFTKSLANESFKVKEMKNGFCRGNFSHRPKGPDFWIMEQELSQRPILLILFLLIICFLPMIIHNFWHGGVSKIETTINTNP